MHATTPETKPTVRRQRVFAAIGGVAVASLAGLLVSQSHGGFSAGKQPVAWQAPIEFGSYDLSGGTAVAFRGDFIRATWDGDLVAYDVSTTGVLSLKWRAREKVPAHGDRKIFTSSTSGTGASFRWDSINATQQGLLGNATTGPQVLSYLRGDSSNEIHDDRPYPTGLFRQRYSSLGAIIHSRPYAHGDVVYAGANDGMLHAFDTASGQELWAYVPSMLFADGRLASLSAPLSTDFPYLVDGSMTIGTVGSATVLVGALGDGAKGLYALDISSPRPSTETAAAGMAKWEITAASAGYANLGNVMTSPQLVTLENDARVVLTPNGLNSSGRVSSLFVIRATDGAKLAEITAGTALPDGTANGLGGIAAVDTNANGKVDAVYAGDLAGTLWKFDLSASSYPSAGTAVFTPSTADARPITAAPSVSRHPRGGLLVNFGTGRVLSSADLASTATEYLYGVWDNGASTSSGLVTQTLTVRTTGAGKPPVRTVSSSSVPYGTGNKGWRIALTDGERLIGGDTLTDSGRYMVTTSIPNTGASQGAWLLQVDALTGSAPAQPFFDLDGDGLVRSNDDSDRIVVTSASGNVAAVPVGRFLGTGVWSQPVLAQVGKSLDLPFLNYNPGTLLPEVTATFTPTPTTTVGGVAGGHFDFDIFYNCSSSKEITKKNCSGQKHSHEYDDKWNVVGVNMLNASENVYNLSNAVTSTSTRFKILVSNTRWSPAAALKIGDAVSAQVWKLPVSPDGFIAETDGGSAKAFTRTSLTNFIYALPADAFSNRDWGTGETRAGLIPTQTGCMQKNENPATAWMDGALTIQVVAESTTGADVQATQPTTAGGYRLKDTSTARTKLLAQYTSFWHHPNGFCKTKAGWTQTPAVDTSAAGSSSTPPAGTADPKGDFYVGEFGTPGGGGGSSGGTTNFFFGSTQVLVNRTFDGQGVSQVLVTPAGVKVSEVRSDFGTAQKAPVQSGQRARFGRLGWKEVVR
jgi:hypothetical protein